MDPDGGPMTRLAFAGRTAILAAVLLPACSHKGPADIATLASNSDQVVFEAGQKAAAKNNWEAARQHYKRVVDGFPQSRYGPDARLALGDSYFREGGFGNYILAISAYRDFLTLYPSHPKSDYAQYQVGECFFLQKSGPDRDQTNTKKALEEFHRLLETYAASGYTEPARTRIRDCRQSLARSEHMAGYFYQRSRKAIRAALSRYEIVLADYPDYDRLDEVLYRQAECLNIMARNAEALPQLNRLVSEYPQSAFADEARRLMAAIEKQGVAPPAPPNPPTPPPTPPPATPQTTPTEVPPPSPPLP
jgi:outer membrane protein assembly factor BamD